MSWKNFIPAEVSSLYEVYDYKHAAVILSKEFPVEFDELCHALLTFRINKTDITSQGGNESNIPKKFSDLLRPKGWIEKQLTAKLVVDNEEITHDTHKIDFLKNKVAFDLEWNSKDQTFDRDLYAFRAFFDYGKISLGVLVTRSDQLETYFSGLGAYTDKYGTPRTYKDKYGASTTHIGKLLPRLNAGRNGGCPVLVFGITQMLIV